MPTFGTRRFRHSGPTSAVSVLPGGRIASSAVGPDETIVWDANSGERLFSAAVPAGELRHMPSQNLLVMAYARVELLELDSGKTWAPSLLGKLRTPIATFADGLVGFDRESSALVVASLRGDQLGRLAVDQRPKSLSLSPDGSQLAVAWGDSGLSLLRARDGSVLWSDATPAQVLTFAADGTVLYVGGKNGTRCHDAADGKMAWHATPDQNTEAIALSPSGRLVGAMGSFGKVAVLRAANGRQRASFASTRADAAVAFVDESTLVCARAYTLGFHHAASGELLRPTEGHEAEISRVAVSKNGRVCATASVDHSARAWDVASGRELHCFEHPNAVEDVALSQDGHLLVTSAADDKVRVWSLLEGRLKTTLTGEASLNDGCVAISPSGHLLARTLHDGVRITAVGETREVGLLQAHEPLRVAFVDDERLLLLTKEGLSLRSVERGTLLAERAVIYEGVLAVSHDGALCAVRDGNEVAVLDTDQLQQRQRIPAFLPTDLAFSSEDILAISLFSGGPLLLWDVVAKKLLAHLDVSSRASALAFVDARTLLVGACDGSAETVTVPETDRQTAARTAFQRSEREDRVVGLLREIALRSAPGYRDAGRRELIDADGLGVRVPTLQPRQVSVRCAPEAGHFAFEIRVAAEGELPAPPGAFARFGNFLRSRLGLGSPPEDPRDVAFADAPGLPDRRVHRLDEHSVIVELRCATLPDADTLSSWLLATSALVDPP